MFIILKDTPTYMNDTIKDRNEFTKTLLECVRRALRMLKYPVTTTNYEYGRMYERAGNIPKARFYYEKSVQEEDRHYAGRSEQRLSILQSNFPQKDL